MRAIIIGGGVAGAAGAIALRRLGCDVTVYEAYPDPAGQVGSFLSLAVNGLRGLDTLDCLEEVRRAGIDVARQHMWSSSGRLLGDVPRGRLSGDPMHSVTLARGHLVEVLRDHAVRAGAELVTGERLTGAVTTATEVGAEFTSGRTDHADLLVGADGIWSRTRTVLDPNAPAPEYAGLFSVSGVAEMPAGLTVTPGTFNMTFARNGAFIHVPAPNRALWWSAQVASPDEPDLNAVADWIPELTDLYRHEKSATAILESTVEVHRPTLMHKLAAVPTWHNDRVVLLGDAGHPVGAGQGASMAIEDALVLARSLAAARDIRQALADYAQTRRTRIAKMVKAASDNRDAKTAGPIERRINDLVMPVFFRHFYERATGWLYNQPTPA
ncbi:FAD-dependent oxidoreductase [Nonomuraea sp. 10N515B]|uniref:FAD-dependent oxidoreductase n=1 Tax=Nonomuraea sp. 10N515B TaxID=3457422 RepID=UPI003FCEBB12